jgi:hypothetical protein
VVERELYDKIVYVYFFRQELGKLRAYPLNYVGFRRANEGVVFLQLVRKKIGLSVVNLASEIVKLLGASSKASEYGSPIFPTGFVDPLQDPLYPQEFGEITLRNVPSSNEIFRPAKGLSEIRLSAATAYEIGWISKVQHDDYYNQLK